MEDIAAEAQVGKGTLYRYFTDKEELFISLLDRSFQQFIDRLNEVKKGFADPRSRLVEMVSAIVRFFDEQPHLFDLVQRAEVLRGANQASAWQERRAEFVE